MCAISLVMDAYSADYWKYLTVPPQPAWSTWSLPVATGPGQVAIDQFVDLIRRAAKYDRDTNQRNCEKPELMTWAQTILDNFDAYHRKLADIVANPDVCPRCGGNCGCSGNKG